MNAESGYNERGNGVAMKKQKAIVGRQIWVGTSGMITREG